MPSATYLFCACLRLVSPLPPSPQSFSPSLLHLFLCHAFLRPLSLSDLDIIANSLDFIFSNMTKEIGNEQRRRRTRTSGGDICDLPQRHAWCLSSFPHDGVCVCIVPPQSHNTTSSNVRCCVFQRINLHVARSRPVGTPSVCLMADDYYLSKTRKPKLRSKPECSE